MKPEKAILLLQRGLVGEIYDEKGYLTALGYEALDAIDSSKCPTLVQRPHGKWVEWINGYYMCSNCDVTVTKEEAEDFYYCPKCGSDNKEEEL